MKKIILSLLLIGSTFFAEAARQRIKLTRSGSKDGVHFNRITEKHEGNSHTLSCLDPGSTPCGWTRSPEIRTISGSTVSSKTIEEWVLNEIASGNISGNTVYLETGIEVSWSSKGLDSEIYIIEP